MATEIARLIEGAIDALLQRGLPADRLINQAPAGALPPTGNTGSGYTPADHASEHEDGGGDEIDLGNLDGELTDGQHGDRAGGSLHAAATTSVAGFQSAADKAKEDAYPAISGLTTGHVLTVTGAAAAAFQAPAPATPTGPAGGVLGGTYPNPAFAADMATQAELDAHAADTTSVHGIIDTSVLLSGGGVVGQIAFFDSATGVIGVSTFLLDAANVAVLLGKSTGLSGAGDFDASGRIQSKSGTGAAIRLDHFTATGNFALSLSPATLSADRRATFPDATGTVDLLELAQAFTAAKQFDAGAFIKQSLAAATTLTVPTDYSLVLAGPFTNDGTLVINGTMAII